MGRGFGNLKVLRKTEDLDSDIVLYVVGVQRLLVQYIFSFFFQAEDGIRDWSVTGVQTCALPISAALAGERSRQLQPRRGLLRPGQHHLALALEVVLQRHVLPADGGAGGCHQRAMRSGERRVGEESRSRWSPYH